MAFKPLATATEDVSSMAVNHSAIPEAVCDCADRRTFRDYHLLSCSLYRNVPKTFATPSSPDSWAKQSPAEKQPMIGTFFNLPPADFDRMKATAKEAGVPVSQLCRLAITQFLDSLDETCRLVRFHADRAVLGKNTAVYYMLRAHHRETARLRLGRVRGKQKRFSLLKSAYLSVFQIWRVYANSN